MDCVGNQGYNAGAIYGGGQGVLTILSSDFSSKSSAIQILKYLMR